MATHVSRILRAEAVFVCVVRSASTGSKNVKHFPMVVLGGGTGGTSVAARACRMLGAGNVAVVDPAKVIIFLSSPLPWDPYQNVPKNKGAV